jgi:hypothetical protein
LLYGVVFVDSKHDVTTFCVVPGIVVTFLHGYRGAQFLVSSARSTRYLTTSSVLTKPAPILFVLIAHPWQFISVVCNSVFERNVQSVEGIIGEDRLWLLVDMELDKEGTYVVMKSAARARARARARAELMVGLWFVVVL